MPSGLVLNVIATGITVKITIPYEIEIDNDNQIVVARILGRATREEHGLAREEATQFCCGNGFKRALVDLRDLDTAGVFTPESIFEFGGLLAGDERLKDVQIAQVLPTEISTRVDIDFSASIAEIKGKAIGRFTTVEQAKRWLKQ